MTTATRIVLDPPKTYATRENAIQAVIKAYGPDFGHAGMADVRYVIATTEAGRFFPLFIGQSAIAAGVHFRFAVAN